MFSFFVKLILNNDGNDDDDDDNDDDDDDDDDDNKLYLWRVNLFSQANLTQGPHMCW